MQGAFAEHQVMLQKLRIDKPIKIALVRQAVDLEQCDGLIIPGGGKHQRYKYFSTVWFITSNSYRIDNYCPSRTSGRINRAFEGVHTEEASLGYLCWCHFVIEGG